MNGNGSAPDEYLTVAQVATKLHRSKITIYRLAAKGKLPGCIKIGGAWLISATVLAEAFRTPTLSPDAAEAILQAMPASGEC